MKHFIDFRESFDNSGIELRPRPAHDGTDGLVVPVVMISNSSGSRGPAFLNNESGMPTFPISWSGADL